ncbi:EAL domain-containing protein [Priestia aryabhattai]|uniref:EAL domain-containing protein n=1 Tax=Priestia aryabhattai TaxID=412384 RepID=UPI002E225FDE|nr:EAL domain-containing protein [Priestia aryabhattai]
MGCDACLPIRTGYTVSFQQSRDVKKLEKYFKDISQNQWKTLGEDMIWMREDIFWSFMDYVHQHLDPRHVWAVEAKQRSPFENLRRMEPITAFQKMKDALWIDELIEDKRICSYYQPIVSVDHERVHIVGHEILSRGLEEDGSIIPPFKMFEAAQIRNKTFALDRACRLEAVKNASIIDHQLIFINFIPTAIYNPEHCLASTFTLIKELNIKPEQIVFEVIETEDVQDIEHLKNILNYYRSHGFKYALDDVGVGYNTLNRLLEVEPDVVKLAFEFTNGVSKNEKQKKVAQEMLAITHKMGAQALAEGVETEEDLKCLIEMGYDLFQGYYFAKPNSKPLKEIHSIYV